MNLTSLRMIALIPAVLVAGLSLGCATDNAEATQAQSPASLETGSAGSTSPDARGPGRHHGGARPDFDLNKDGTVTDAERTEARKAHMTERFTADDKNKDGALTKDEVPEDKWARISQADANSDGTVTQAELETAMASHKMGPRGPRGEGGPMERGERPDFDLNKDGTVTDAERTEARKAHLTERFTADDQNKDGTLTQDEIPPGMWEHMSAADANSDGKLTLDELTTAIESGKLVPMGPRGHRGGPHGEHDGAPADASEDSD
jgi:hypothetical protein